METASVVRGLNSNSLMKKGVKAELQLMDVSFLVELIPEIPEDVQKQFGKEYGRLVDLLLIPIDMEALKILSAMIQYWSPNLRVFEFPQVDASPTIEEYEVLLDIQVQDREKVYLFTENHNITEDLIQKLIGVRPCPSSIVKQGMVYGLRWKFLKKHIVQMVEQGRWELFKPAFALAIYGMVLFPFVHDMIDQATIDVFAKFKSFEVNPVPAILAETLISFQKCHERGHFKIRCCVQLLYVWMITRFKHHQYPDWSRYPLRRFRNITVKPMGLLEWKKLFNEVTLRNFGTKTRLYEKHFAIMYSCGELPYMMLMGPRGCISFTPALVFGQLNWGMTPIRPEQLQRVYIWYKDEGVIKEELDLVRNALKRIHLIGQSELGEHQALYTKEYKLWRDQRRKGQATPSISLPRQPYGPSEIELLRRQLKIMEAKLEEARDKSDKDELTIGKRDKIINDLKREEASLKRDYTQMCNQSDKFRLIMKDVEKMDVQLDGYKEQIKSQNRIINAAKIEKRDLEVRVEQLQTTLHESQQKENRAWIQLKEYQSALDGALNREDRLKGLLEETQKNHRDSLGIASQNEDRLSRQLWDLKEAYDKMIADQEVWSDNWNEVLRESCRERDDWENRCKHVIDGFGDFADEWLKTFYDAKREVEVYPEVELLPAMKASYELCKDVAKDLRRWRDIANREF